MKQDLVKIATVHELAKGYLHDKENDTFVCLFCSKVYENGVVYPRSDGSFTEAEKSIKEHIIKEHGSVLEGLLELPLDLNGLSKIQQELMLCYHKKLTDAETVEILEGGNTSTIRNHRFKLREKAQKMKVFYTIMELFYSEENCKKREEILKEIYKK